MEDQETYMSGLNIKLLSSTEYTEKKHFVNVDNNCGNVTYKGNCFEHVSVSEYL